MSDKKIDASIEGSSSLWAIPYDHPNDIPTLVQDTDLYMLVEYFAGLGQGFGTNVRYTCPNPGHIDNHPSFSVTTFPDGKQRAKCWSQCAWDGDALDFVEWCLGIAKCDAVNWLKDWNSEESAESSPPSKSISPPESKPAPVDTSTKATGIEAQVLMTQYLVTRHWPSSVVERFSLEVVYDSSGAARIRHPYLLPTTSGELEATYWQDRSLKQSTVKWLSPKNRESIPFNLQSLEPDNLEVVVICEGPADTITASLALEGYSHVAIIGIAGVNAWRKEYVSYVEGLRIVVAADNDEAGRTMETQISQSVSRPVIRVRPSHGDLTDTAINEGLDAVRKFLISALGVQPEAKVRTLDEQTAMFREELPQGHLEGESK